MGRSERGIRVKVFSFRVSGLRFKVLGYKFRVQGLGLRDGDLGFRVWRLENYLGPQRIWSSCLFNQL